MHEQLTRNVLRAAVAVMAFALFGTAAGSAQANTFPLSGVVVDDHYDHVNYTSSGRLTWSRSPTGGIAYGAVLDTPATTVVRSPSGIESTLFRLGDPAPDLPPGHEIRITPDYVPPAAVWNTANNFRVPARVSGYGGILYGGSVDGPLQVLAQSGPQLMEPLPTWNMRGDTLVAYSISTGQPALGLVTADGTVTTLFSHGDHAPGHPGTTLGRVGLGGARLDDAGHVSALTGSVLVRHDAAGLSTLSTTTYGFDLNASGKTVFNEGGQLRLHSNGVTADVLDIDNQPLLGIDKPRINARETIAGVDMRESRLVIRDTTGIVTTQSLQGVTLRGQIGHFELNNRDEIAFSGWSAATDAPFSIFFRSADGDISVAIAPGMQVDVDPTSSVDLRTIQTVMTEINTPNDPRMRGGDTWHSGFFFSDDGSLSALVQFTDETFGIVTAMTAVPEPASLSLLALGGLSLLRKRRC